MGLLGIGIDDEGTSVSLSVVETKVWQRFGSSIESKEFGNDSEYVLVVLKLSFWVSIVFCNPKVGGSVLLFPKILTYRGVFVKIDHSEFTKVCFLPEGFRVEVLLGAASSCSSSFLGDGLADSVLDLALGFFTTSLHAVNPTIGL